ncbi:MAG TPA: DUF6249 domain-containing protein [Candidatus Baltobacteraceae bacterium]
MADPSDTIVPVVGVLVIFGLPLTYAIVNRVLAHQERVEMLKRGIVPPPDARSARRMGRGGWYDPGMYAGAQPGADAADYGCCGGPDPNRMLRKGITLTMIGFALFIGLSFINIGHFGPWLLGGLIPLFVGLAQIIIAVLSGANLGPLAQQWGPPGAPPPPPGQSQAPGQQPFTGPRDVTPPGGYAGWRPGATTGLEKPPSPPDVR